MKYVFGNWKMYVSHKESVALAHSLAACQYNASKVTVGVFPSMLSLVAVQEQLQSTTIAVGAQQVAWTPSGPYTGAVSTAYIAESGATHALVGHSERRHVFGESNEDIRKRLEAALGVGLTIVLCIGETQEDLDNGKREYRLRKQLMKAVEGLDIPSGKLIVAYEPVWAISNAGAGKPCSPEDAEAVHAFIKKELDSYSLVDIPLLYGGSVKPENVVSYMSLPSVDGVLVGSASTKADVFTSLIATVESM